MLGAAVGEAAAGRQVGRRAALWGALCGTLPDLDVFVPLGDPVSDFTYHRSASHSLLVLALLTPLVTWLILKLHPGTRPHRRRWMLAVYLVFATHVLLDSFTVYGTQIFWPVWTMPMTWSTVFIIDPAFTLPLLVGVVALLVLRGRPALGHRLNAVGLALSTAYLAWTVGAKLHVDEAVAASLARQGIEYERLVSTPAPFNTLLWRAVARGEGGYHEVFYSLVDGSDEATVFPHESRDELIAPVAETWPVARLQWFTKGFYKVERRGNDVHMTDLRMGVEPGYVFSFRVARLNDEHVVPATVERVEPVRDWGRLGWLWRRIWSADA